MKEKNQWNVTQAYGHKRKLNDNLIFFCFLFWNINQNSSFNPLFEYKQISCPWNKKNVYIRKQQPKKQFEENQRATSHGDYVNLIQKDKSQNNNRFIND